MYLVGGIPSSYQLEKLTIPERGRRSGFALASQRKGGSWADNYDNEALKTRQIAVIV